MQPTSGEADPLTNGQEGDDIKKLSHGVAIILLFSKHLWIFSSILILIVHPVYASYLVFQLWSHSSLYDDKSGQNFRSTRYNKDVRTQMRYMRRTILRRRVTEDVEKHGEIPNDVDGQAAPTDAVAEEEEEQPSMSFPMCIGLLAVVTVVSTGCS